MVCLDARRVVPCAFTELNLLCIGIAIGDVFILDDGLMLYQWNGKQANKYEKVKALEVITKINDERGHRAKLHFLDSGKEDAAFWGLLGGNKGLGPITSDDEVKETPVQLYRISDASGQMNMTLVGEGKLRKDMLDTNDVFLVDSGAQVFVWIGKGATKEEKSKGMSYGADYLKQHGRPSWTPLTRVVENAEDTAFKACFVVWTPPQVVDFKQQKKPEPKPDDFSAFFKRQKAAEEKMASTDGTLTVWVIDNFDKVLVDKSLHGQFYSGDSYILQYKYKQGTRDAVIIYFWQGRKSSQDEKGTSALLTKQLSDELKMSPGPSQVRVVQNAEPAHFIALFKGNMVIHEGGRAGAFKNRAEADSFHSSQAALYHVRGTNQHNTRAVQVAEQASSLNSGDCFVLVTSSTAFAWLGSGANDTERAVAHNVVNLLSNGRAVVALEEGSEPAEFWEALGGQAEYASSSTLQNDDFEPRLFQVNNTQGHIKVKEIFNYSQDDLLDDDVMILDAGAEVYVWIGNGAQQAEKEGAVAAALQYVQNAPDERSPDTPIFTVPAGAEPLSFTCHFLGWDAAKASDFEDPYAKKLAAAKKTSGAGPADDAKSAPAPAGKPAAAPAAVQRVTSVAAAVGGQFKDFNKEKFTAAQIKAGVDGLDPLNKHQYLNEAEFKAVFGMAVAEFNAMPGWKKDAAKKKAGLF